MTPDAPQDEITAAWQEQGRKLFAKECAFMLGVATLPQLPPEGEPEIAFIGRSNVGKSSLINALTGRKNLARASVTAGRTQQINFFNLGGTLRIVDLPGYGFAKAPPATVQSWHRLIFSYLTARPDLKRVFVLIDSRRGVGDKDIEVMQMLDSAAVSYQLVFTKGDKTTKAELAQHLTTARERLASHPAAYPEIIATSSAKKDGIAELRGAIARLILPH